MPCGRVAKLDADRRVEAVGKLDNLFPLVALFIIPDSGALRGDPTFGDTAVASTMMRPKPPAAREP